MEKQQPIKLFISYSWSSETHKAWVERLAKKLVRDGVDVIIDIWELKEGHSINNFMELMITDPNIEKVLIVCDETYSKKANAKKGGVGVETQIISGEVYNNQKQEKFVCAVTQNDKNGKPFLPVYYKDRMYIDFTDADNDLNSYQQLLRWIYKQPAKIKPQLGTPPDFINNNDKGMVASTNESDIIFFEEVKNEIFTRFRNYQAKPDHCIQIQHELILNYPYDLNPKQRALLQKAIQHVINQGYVYHDIRFGNQDVLVLTEKGFNAIYQ